MEPEGASLPSAAVIGAVAIVIALLLGGAVLLRDRAARDDTTEPDAGLSTPVGGEADGTRSAESCDARADAAALAVEAGLYDYDASDSPGDLASNVDLVLTGQLLAARSGSGGQQASVVVKPRRMELGEGSPPNAFGLPVVDVDRVGQTANFIAFLRSNPAAPGGYDVAVDGLWLSCDDQDLAYPVFDHPVGWAEVNSIESIVSRVRDFRRVGQPLDTRIVGDGTSVSRVRLVDNTEFALFLPESFGTDLMLGQDDTVGGVAQVQGQEFALSIDIDFCREDNLFPNDSGLFVTSLLDNSSTEGVLLCRPDEFITMRLHPLPPFEFSLRDFDIIPISFGGDYQAFIRQYGLTRGQCCFEDRGPMWIDGDMIVADGVTGHQIRRLEGDTLVPQWTIDLADLIDSPREWLGDGAFLHGVDESGTVVTSTGFGFLLGVDSATGDRSWSIDLEGHSAEGLARTGGGAWLATTDIGGEGDQTAPKLWRFDGSSGDVLWVAEGEPVSDLQWDRPRTIGEVVVIADVPSYTENPTGDETAHVLAFDIDTGERRWTFDLESHIESFIARGTITALNLDDEPILLAANVEGVLFRIDPATGSEIWRNDALPGQGPVIVAGVNGPLEYTVQRGPVYTDVDGATGLPRTG